MTDLPDIKIKALVNFPANATSAAQALTLKRSTAMLSSTLPMRISRRQSAACPIRHIKIFCCGTASPNSMR